MLKFAMIQRSCALVALLALFLQGSSGGHMLLAEHHRCAEHGELVHGGGPQQHAVAETARAASVELLGGMPASDSDEAHDHCSAFANRRDARLAGLGTMAPAHRFEESQDTAVREATVVAGAPRFRVAPKTSPPA